jgi:hypothetical protein
MKFQRFRICTRVATCALLLHTVVTNAEPQNGWWWNPSESGRGFFIEARNGLLYVGGYFYAEDGRATWMTSGGPLTDAYAYSGRLASYHGGQTVFGPYRAPDSAIDVGPITLHFADDAHGTLTWPGGTVAIERELVDEEEPVYAALFALFDPPFRPQTGWWWNEAESGTGFSLEVRGNTLFVVAFMYDDAGNPVWYLTAGPMQSPTHYEGDWLAYSGGQTLTGPYRLPSNAVDLGRMVIDFTAADGGTIEFIEAATAKDASSRKNSRNRSVRANQLGPMPNWPYPAQWPKWSGGLQMTRTNALENTYEEEAFTYGISYRIEPPQAPGRTTYSPEPSARFIYHILFRDTETHCEQKGDVTIDTAVTGLLTVRDDLSYVGAVHLTTPVIVPIVEKCVDPSDGSVTTTDLAPRPVAGEVEFGGSRLFGAVNRIVGFYPSYSYQPGNGRPPPTMTGNEPLRDDFFLHWTLVAP